MLDPGGEGVDRLIEYTIGLIEAYEQVGGHLETVVRGLLWALTHRGGRATEADLLADPTLASHLDQARAQLEQTSVRLADQVNGLMHFPELHRAVTEDRLKQLLCDAQSGLTGRKQLVEQVLERHQRVQQQKRKGIWIERDAPYLTLIPGFGDNREAPWSHDGTYLHPFRVTNAYSLLGDLGRIRKVEVPDAEEE
jgi:hypothetical protein